MKNDRPKSAQSPCSSTAQTLVEAAPVGHAPALKFDPKEYRHFLGDSGWTDAQKDEFTEALWQIIVGFVDLGFNLHPIQQVVESQKTLELDSPGVITFQDISENKNTKIAGLPHEKPAERPDS